jgi:hypothetical protein
MSSCSDDTVGQNCRTKFRMSKNARDVFWSATESGFSQSIAGAALGAGWPRKAESGSAL